MAHYIMLHPVKLNIHKAMFSFNWSHCLIISVSKVILNVMHSFKTTSYTNQGRVERNVDPKFCKLVIPMLWVTYSFILSHQEDWNLYDIAKIISASQVFSYYNLYTLLCILFGEISEFTCKPELNLRGHISSLWA